MGEGDDGEEEGDSEKVDGHMGLMDFKHLGWWQQGSEGTTSEEEMRLHLFYHEHQIN